MIPGALCQGLKDIIIKLGIAHNMRLFELGEGSQARPTVLDLRSSLEGVHGFESHPSHSEEFGRFKKIIEFWLFKQTNSYFLFFSIVHTAGGGPAANAGDLPPLRKANTQIMSVAPLPRPSGAE
jgi:hypothetical protein